MEVQMIVQIAIILVYLAAIFIITNLCIFLNKAILLWLKNIKLLEIFPYDTQAITFHTYKPKGSNIPKRGKIIAEHAYNIAKKLGVPIILSVGKTVPDKQSMECELYQEYIYSNLGHVIEVIIGRNKNVRDTYGEVKETYRIAKKNNFQKIGVVALLPHLVWRIIPFWQAENKSNDLIIRFNGILGPKKYIIWEFLMLILETYLPPGSSRRNFCLKISKRHR